MAFLRHKFHRLVGLVLVLLLAAAPAARGALAPRAADELSVKAAFLLNFAAFIAWPPQAFPTADSPFVVGIYGRDPFGRRIEEIFAGESVNGRRFEVRRIPAGGDVSGCHIVFISDSERGALRSILRSCRGQPTVTVSNAPQFNENGGIIEFTTDRNRVRFRINRAAAEQAGVQLSSRLLRLAEPG